MPSARLDNDVQINYTISGSNKVNARIGPMTMMACSNQMFQGIMERSNQLLSFDYRGTGKSTGPSSLDGYTAAAYTEDMRQLFAKTGIRRSAIVGYSHGGFFGVDFTLQHPEQVSALVLVEPALFFDQAKLKERIKTVLENKEAGIKLLLQQIAPDLARDKKAYADLVSAISERYPDAIGLAGEWQARVTNEIGEDDLCDIRVPTLVITGERSRVRRYTARAGKAIPRAMTWVIPGASHLVLDEKPNEVAAVINLFLGQYGGGVAARKPASGRKR